MSQVSPPTEKAKEADRATQPNLAKPQSLWDRWEWSSQMSVVDRQSLVFSAALHAALLTLLAFLAVSQSEETPAALTMRTDTTLESLQRLESSEALPNSSLAGITEAAPVSMSPDVKNIAIADPVSQKPLEISSADVRLANVAMPKTEPLRADYAIQGSGAEHVEGGVEGAINRIAVEILRRLEQGPTLVVWAFDASGSLVAERERLTKHIGGVYQDVLKLDDKQLSAGENLLTAIVSFGENRRPHTQEPTSNIDEIVSAIKAVPLDRTGYESTFATAAEVAQKWGKYRKGKTRYQTIAIIVTDEVGDDEDKLEVAIQSCKSTKTAVYVLGSAALFGQTLGLVPYTDPVTKQSYAALPVRQGPESVRLEQIRLPFWDEKPPEMFMNSGFGPFALSRLTASTGGIYFITRMAGTRIDFDPARMMEYKPEWIPEAEYLARVQADPLRMAINQAALVTQQNLPGRPALTFPPTGTEAFKDAMRENQVLAARTQMTVDEALEFISKVAKLRDRETSKRWQAHYDLIKGRLTVVKVRCLEYNWACAQMKTNPLKFKNPKSNAWRLVPDKDVHFSDKAAEAAKTAQELLKVVVKEHPQTPWALMAERELQIPLGYRWEETYVEPPRPAGDAPNQKKMVKKDMPSKPPELPKL